MCFVLYIAASEPLPLVARTTPPRFSVESEDDGLDAVRARFTKPHVYYVGSASGCGCSFRREPLWVLEQTDVGDADRSAIEASQRALVAFVRDALTSLSDVELYGCWDGGERVESTEDRQLTVAEFASDEFYFREGERVTVVRSERGHS